MEPTPDEARRTAAEGWIWGFALLENYRTLYPQAVDADDPRYVGGFGRFRHYSRPFTPANTDVVTPNNDTPYSWAWLDLRAEPWVVSVLKRSTGTTCCRSTTSTPRTSATSAPAPPARTRATISSPGPAGGDGS